MSDPINARQGPRPKIWSLILPPAAKVLHPVALFSAVWLGVLFLYAFQLSHILRYTAIEAALVVIKLWVPFTLSAAVVTGARHALLIAYPRASEPLPFNVESFEGRLAIFFKIWLVITALEIGVSGGVPIVWAFSGSGKIYTDYGIHSLHGFVLSLQTALSLCYVLLYMLTQQRRFLKVPLFIMFWAIVIINRNMMLVMLIEWAVLYIRLRSIRFKTALRILIGAFTFVLAFGIVGDIRQGPNSLIRDLAQPTEQYPDWLPSGVLWAYIYATTPINNLVYTIETIKPQHNFLFPNTIVTLFPSFIRQSIYGESIGDAESGSLVISAFNVSTAYVGPYQDFGYIGVCLFSAGIAGVTVWLWYSRNLRGIALFSVVSQCLVLTLFFNHFFTLPVITQLAWLWFFFTPISFNVRLPDTWTRTERTSSGKELSHTAHSALDIAGI